MEEIRKRKRSLTGPCLFVAFLVASYVLSIAPVQWLVYKGPMMGAHWRDVSCYRPLVEVIEVTPDCVGELLESYATMLLPKPSYRTHGGII